MASINSIVNVTITKGSQQVTRLGFGVPLIIGPSNHWSDLARVYSSASAMLTDGFLISDPEYIHALELTSQVNIPPSFVVGKFSAAVAEVDTLSVNTVTDSFLYSFTLNGIPVSFTSGAGSTQQSILDGLLAAIATAFPTNSPVTGIRTLTGPSAILTLTSVTAGLGLSFSAVGTKLTLVNLTPNHSLSQDVAAIQGINDNWYGLISCSKLTNDILQLASYIEGQKKIYVASSSDAGILTTSITDVASLLSVKKYSRTALMYSATPAAGPEAAWIGTVFPQGVGVTTWKFKTLAGITPDSLSANQISNAQGKNANVYIALGGVNIASEGTMSDGEFIDIIRGTDALVSDISTNVYSLLVNAGKVPYTNKGIATVQNAIAGTLQDYVGNGFLSGNPAPVVTVPDALAVSQADKLSRTLNNVVFNATYAGAIHKVNIQGFLSF